MCQIFVRLCLAITIISFSSYHRGRSISSLQVPEYSYYMGYKWVSANTRTTCGKNLNEEELLLCRTKELFPLHLEIEGLINGLGICGVYVKLIHWGNEDVSSYCLT